MIETPHTDSVVLANIWRKQAALVEEIKDLYADSLKHDNFRLFVWQKRWTTDNGEVSVACGPAKVIPDYIDHLIKRYGEHAFLSAAMLIEREFTADVHVEPRHVDKMCRPCDTCERQAWKVAMTVGGDEVYLYGFFPTEKGLSEMWDDWQAAAMHDRNND